MMILLFGSHDVNPTILVLSHHKFHGLSAYDDEIYTRRQGFDINLLCFVRNEALQQDLAQEIDDANSASKSIPVVKLGPANEVIKNRQDIAGQKAQKEADKLAKQKQKEADKAAKEAVKAAKEAAKAAKAAPKAVATE